MELLAPAGNFEKLKTAFHFGADAVYMAGQSFGLRAFAGNFDDAQLNDAVQYAHNLGKKVYITINILAHENDFINLKEYLIYLEKIKVDAVIVADIGVIKFIRDNAPSLAIHVSTQANVLNSFAINFLHDMGVKRIILARELSVDEIATIRQKISKDIELECFVHGAMCISYSGRCLLSKYMTGRDANHGECVQACRWKYYISKQENSNEKFEIAEDERGTYIMNSKDMNMLKYIDKLAAAGIVSMKIEGRMKSEYYVGNVVNAYRRALDLLENNSFDNNPFLDGLNAELIKSSHRKYTTAFYFGADDKECLESSMPVQTHEFIAMVVEDMNNNFVVVEQRNRFAVGDELEVLSPDENLNKIIVVEHILNENNEEICDAKNVQERVKINCNFLLKKGDILRRKLKNI